MQRSHLTPHVKRRMSMAYRWVLLVPLVVLRGQCTRGPAQERLIEAQEEARLGSTDASTAAALRAARRAAQAAQAHAQAMEERALAASAAEEEAASARSQVEWLRRQLQVKRGRGRNLPARFLSTQVEYFRLFFCTSTCWTLSQLPIRSQS